MMTRSPRADISLRQRVNQICRALQQAGMVRRMTGPDGKIVNEWLGAREPDGSSPPTDVTPGTGTLSQGAPSPAARAVPDGDSGEQRDAERVMLDLLGAQLDRWLNAGRTRDRRNAPSATKSWPTPSSSPG